MYPVSSYFIAVVLKQQTGRNILVLIMNRSIHGYIILLGIKPTTWFQILPSFKWGFVDRITGAPITLSIRLLSWSSGQGTTVIVSVNDLKFCQMVLLLSEASLIRKPFSKWKYTLHEMFAVWKIILKRHKNHCVNSFRIRSSASSSNFLMLGDLRYFCIWKDFSL